MTSIYSEMQEKGIVPEIVTCTALIEGYFRKGDIVEVRRLSPMTRSG